VNSEIPRATPLAAASWPRLLTPGDRVALVSPAGPPDQTLVEEGERLMRSWGLDVAHSALLAQGYLAGSDDERFRQLGAAFDDEEVRAILCTRGGYGSQRLVDRLRDARTTMDAFVQRRASFVGFSDITAVHQVLNDVGLVTFYGPPLAWVLRNGPSSLESLRRVMFEGTDVVLESDASNPTAALTNGDSFTGRTIGGNLTMLAASVGTATQLVAEGAIVVMEDCDERPLDIDRALTQLIRSSAFTGVGAFAIGQFDRCADLKYGADVIQTLHERLAHVAAVERREIPLLGGLAFGHGDDQQTLPLGAVATIDPAAGRLAYTR